MSGFQYVDVGEGIELREFEGDGHEILGRFLNVNGAWVFYPDPDREGFYHTGAAKVIFWGLYHLNRGWKTERLNDSIKSGRLK